MVVAPTVANRVAVARGTVAARNVVAAAVIPAAVIPAAVVAAAVIPATIVAATVSVAVTIARISVSVAIRARAPEVAEAEPDADAEVRGRRIVPIAPRIPRVVKAGVRGRGHDVGMLRRGVRRLHGVRGEIVVEVAAVGHLLDDVGHRRFRIVRRRRVFLEPRVVPMAVADEIVYAVRIHGHRCVDGAAAGARDLKRITIAASADLVVLSRLHEVVVARIYREQHAHAAVGVRVQHDDVSVVAHPDGHARTVAAIVALVIERDPDCGFCTRSRRRRCRRRGGHDRKHERNDGGNHGSSCSIPSPGPAAQR